MRGFWRSLIYAIDVRAFDEGSNMKIRLASGKFAVIDDEDYHKISQHKWRVCGKGYARTGMNGPYMQRVILNVPDDREVDHINGDGLDNRKCNLRIVTTSENQMNRGPQKNNTSGYKGVWLSNPRGGQWKRWIAEIRVNGKRNRLGYFETKEDAALAYNKKASECYGEVAQLNMVPCLRKIA